MVVTSLGFLLPSYRLKDNLAIERDSVLTKNLISRNVCALLRPTQARSNEAKHPNKLRVFIRGKLPKTEADKTVQTSQNLSAEVCAKAIEVFFEPASRVRVRLYK